ncbi:MAG: lamin tail domain-containing protein [Anaerolineae bacterium]|nr:lamin tail domain-containing protein [Anaerolineae bacterium]
MNPRHYRNILLSLMAAMFLVSVLAAAMYHPPAAAQARQAAIRDVVINEVAWAGTAASASDEWIELYNNTAMTIALENWRLYAADGSPTITLHGEIAPLGYYLLERTGDDTVSDIPADWIGSFTNGLGNGGETLILADASGVTIDTANGNGGDWPGGNISTFASMERLDPTAPDSDANWIGNNGLYVNGLDADGAPLRGTPKAANSVYVTDLAVSKRGPAIIMPGEQVTYILTLGNQGVRSAGEVRLTDTLPALLTFESQSTIAPFSFTQTGNILEWTLATLPTGTQHTIVVTATLAEAAAGSLRNNITATTSTRERTSSNNSAGWLTTIQALDADLAVEKTGPMTVAPGSLLTYSIRLENIGLTAAEGVAVTDTLPSDVEFVAQQTSLTVYTFTQLNQHTLVWDAGGMPVNTSVWVTVTGRVIAGTFWMPLINHVTAGAQTAESNLDNNSDDWTTTLIDPREPHVLISGVLYQGYQTGQLDEAIQLVNVGPVTANIGTWEVCKGAAGGLTCRALPSGSTIAPDARVWLARNRDAFTASFGFAPDYVLGSWWAGLSDNGDALVLRNDEQDILDTLVYKGGQTPFSGWTGPALLPYGNNVGRETGQILYRIPDEASGLPVPDTNTAADWIQYTGNITQGRRVLYPGWDLDPLFWPLSATEAATVAVGIAPDNAYEVISQTILQAQESISIEVYALRHPLLLQALVAKANAGVHVTLLLEGSTVGVGVNTVEWQTQLEVCRQIEATGNGECWFMIHETADNIYNRYDYIHAKLIIVDNAWVVVSTQNLTRSSLPVDDKTNGTYGTRGAVVSTNAPSVVERAMQVFAADFDPVHHNDLLRWNTGYTDKYGMPILELVDLGIPDMMSYTVRFAQPLITHGTFEFEFLTSPEAALRQSDALLGLVNRAGAGDTLYVQQMYEFSEWNDAANPRLEAYIEAARRGAAVRVLVNSKSFVEGYAGTPLDSQETVSYVNAIAQSERLDLEAFMCDPTGSGIHNKMVLVDLHDEGKFSHVGSINGSETSSKVNREVAIQIKSEAVYDYLAQMFTSDWWLARPIYLPLVMRLYAPPPPPRPPVEYLVISEVYYQGGPDGEWVEIYNPTKSSIGLNGYKIGDYDGAGYNEGIYAFPITATIPPGEVIVVAGDGHQVNPPADFELFDYNADIPTLPKVGGDGDWALGNTGDQVILWGPDGQVVDVVVWGTATYPGVIAHPGVAISTHSLERYPAYYDTDDCSYDFRDRYPASPGTVPVETQNLASLHTIALNAPSD